MSEMYRILGLLAVIIAASSSVRASSLRHKSFGQQLFGQCSDIGTQCGGVAHSVCAEAPTRMKRNAADVALLKASIITGSGKLNARDGLNEYGSDGENNNEAELESSSSREIRGKTEVLPPIVKETEKTRVLNSVKHIYKDIHTRSRVNINQNVVQKHVYIHDVKKIHRDLTVNHVNHNHHTDIVKHVQPILNKVYITREQQIVQPLQKTIITRTESESEKEVVHPTVVSNKYKDIQLPTVVEKTQNLGVVESVGRGGGGEGERINRGDEWRNDGNNGAYELDDRASDIPRKQHQTNEQAVADALARFKRATDSGAAAVCLCAEGFVPSKSLDGCV